MDADTQSNVDTHGDAAALLGAEDLQALACFAYDVGEPGRPLPATWPLASLPVGSKLQKTRLPLAGTTELTRPVSTLRVLVFAREASVAPRGADDPWQLACVDRPAFFALADRFGYRGFTQVALVEMDRAGLARCGERVLDLSATDYVRGLFVGSFGAEEPSYAAKTSFQEIMGNRPGRLPLERLVPCGPHDLDAAEPEGPALDRRLEQHRAEALLATLGDFDTLLEDEDGLYRCRARRHSADGHPGLAFREAQANFAALYREELDARVIERLYSGVLDTMSPMQRDMIADQVWFGSLFLQDFEPVLSDEIDDYLDGMREAYEQSRAAGRAHALPQAMFERLTAWFKRRAVGDVGACATEIEDARSRMRAPFRYEFSASFDEESATARIDLFLPQKAVFPLTATCFELLGSGYASRVLTDEELEDRYARLACRMGVLTLRLVKSKAPWLRRLELEAWYRGEPGSDSGGAGSTAAEGPACLYALSVDEETLARESGGISRDPFETIRALGAAVRRTWDRGLLPVAPLFPLEDALEHRFGFEAFRDGWTRPFKCRALGSEASAEDLDLVIARVEGLLERGDLEGARSLAERAEERYRGQWLDVLPDGARALSCDSAFEELRARRMLAGDGVDAAGMGGAAPGEVHVLPRGLSRLYVALAEVSREAGSPGDARDYLNRARELDPASPRPCFGLVELDLEEGEEEAARELADRAFETSYLARDLARAYRCWGTLEEAGGDYDGAGALFAYSLAVSRDPDTVEECMRELSYLRRRAGRPLAVDPNPVPSLVVAGYPLHASPEVLEISAPPVERALFGGPLPPQSVLAAYLNARDFPDGLSEALTNLLMNVVGDDFGQVSCARYLYQPVILDDVDLPELLGQDSPLLGAVGQDGEGPEEDELGLLAIPYIDAARGLVFDVVAAVDLDSREPVRVPLTGERVTLPAAPLEGAHFLLARTRDYPGLHLEERADLLADFYRTDPGREQTRSVRSIDELRRFDDPDEVIAVLARGGLTPEGVWVRLDSKRGEDGFAGTLMSEPHDEFGLHAGDACKLAIVEDPRVPGGVFARVESIGSEGRRGR